MTATSNNDEVRRMIILDQGTDTELGIVGLGYSPDNGTHFFVTNTIRGRVFRKQDIETLWPLLKDKIQSVMDGSLSVSWADIQNKPDVATQEDLKNIELKPGPQGPQGLPGKDGQNGITPHIDTATGNWFVGSTDTGIKAQGPQGIQGDPGKDGQNGTPGTNGKNGADGKSTYEIWLDNGHTGTETDFLNSLKGAKGDPGKDGKDGESPDPSIFATKNEVQKAQSVADDAAKYARNNAQLIKQANDRIDAIKIPDTSDFVTSNDLISVRNTASSAQEAAREAQSVANSASSIASSAYSLASSANSKASQLENKINQMGKIDSSSQYSNKTPSEYSDGIFYEEKYISTMGIDRSSLDNSAQSGTYGLVTTKVMTINGTKYARQQCEVMDSQRPITFLRNGYSNSWSSWEVNTTLAF